MSNTSELIENTEAGDYAQTAYLNYAMYVIMDRAIPSVTDGLKPVQRRILFAMSELGLKYDKKHKKSARTVGDVLGKYHPHGDSACYEAMVLMAQPFSYRNTTVDGQGNWGSNDDPKSYAAMRYTESKLSRYSDMLLKEVKSGNVLWKKNFDETMDEPIFLPARLPNILLNPNTGIAVGMATEIPPHNTREVGEACLALLKNPETTYEEVRKIIIGPDYPMGAELIASDEILDKMYRTGKAGLKARSTYIVEKDGSIVIDNLPFKVSGSKIIERIGTLMQEKKLPLLSDIQDESDHRHPIRIILKPANKSVDPEMIMSYLYKNTKLEEDYPINMNMIGIDFKPQVKGLMQILSEWIQFRQESVTRRLNARLNKVLKRLHLLEGYKIAFLKINDVIEVIRDNDQPKEILISKFGLSEIQAEGILDLKLRSLSKLEDEKINGEMNELSSEQKWLEERLNNLDKLNELISEELTADVELYGNDRVSQISNRVIESKTVTLEEMLPAEPMTVVVSKKNWIRAAKTHNVDGSALNYKTGDGFKENINCMSNDILAIIDSEGRIYNINVSDLPNARGDGEPISKWVQIKGDAVSVLKIEKSEKYVVCTADAFGFQTEGSNLISKQKAGKPFITLPGKNFLSIKKIGKEDTHLLALTDDCIMLLFPLEDLKEIPRGKGVKIINLKKDDIVSSIDTIASNESIVFSTGKQEKTIKSEEWLTMVSKRALSGKKTDKCFKNNNSIKK